MRIAQRHADFVVAQTRLVRPAYIPEIALHLAAEPFRIWQMADEIGALRPFWAFAWPGGQALARWLLDHPEEVAGRRVLDLGSGSGLSCVAALLSGARQAIANDTDPIACAAAHLNGTANAVAIETSNEDLLAADIEADLILIGELFYEPEMEIRVSAFLDRARRQGAAVLFADRTAMRRPPADFRLIADVVAPLTPDLETGAMQEARIWRLAHASRAARRMS